MYSCNLNRGQKFNFIALQIKITHPINLVFSFKNGELVNDDLKTTLKKFKHH